MRARILSATLLTFSIGLAACAATPATEPAKAPGEAISAAPPAISPTERVGPPFAGLRTNEAVIDLIKSSEGLRLQAYQNSGRWLIGYGHGGGDVAEGMRISPEKADELLRADLLVVENEVKGLVTTPLNIDEFSALVDLVYNIGSGNFRTSTTLSELNAGDRAAAAEAILLWDKVTLNGQRVVSQPLAERRQFERDMFLGDGN